MNRRSRRVPSIPPNHEHHIDGMPRYGLHDLCDIGPSAGGSQDRATLELDPLDGRRSQLDTFAGLVVKTLEAVSHAHDVLNSVAPRELLRQRLDDVVEAGAEAAAGDDGRLLEIGNWKGKEKFEGIFSFFLSFFL